MPDHLESEAGNLDETPDQPQSTQMHVVVRRLCARGQLASREQTFAQVELDVGERHAGVLVLLALACQLYIDVADQSGLVGWLSRSAVAGAGLLGVGVLSLGLGLLVS